MDRFEMQKAIAVLKPLCDSLMKNPNVSDARSVANIVEKVSDKIIQDLLDYILYPIIIHLPNEKLSKSTKEELVKTTKIVISKGRISSIKYFNKLYSYLLIQIYDKTQGNMVIVDHEELKEAVLACIKELIHCCFTEVIEALYTKENAPKIGQGILLSLTIARTEKSRTLRLMAMETVMALCQIDDKVDKSDIILQDQVADVIMLFLPGIASGLQEVAMGNEIQGYKLTVMALKAWGRVISLVMKDQLEEDTEPSSNNLINISSNQINASSCPSNDSTDMDTLNKHLTGSVRSHEWFNAAATKLNILVRELDHLQKHSHYKVRKELIKSIHLLLTTCSRNMKPNVMLLIEYLISLSEDDVTEVSDEAKKALDEVSVNYMQNGNMRPLVQLLEENFYNVLTKLPRIIRRSDDREQLSCLNQLSGYLKLLGERTLPRIMASVAHIRRLLLALVYISEIDSTNISLLQVANVKDLEDPAYFYGSHSWRRFKFIQNKPCEEKLIRICKYLGEFGDRRVLIDNVLGLITETPQHRKELILLLNWMIHVPLKDSSHMSLYKEIIDLYISSELWYPGIEVTEEVSLRAAQNNIVQCCLLLEGLGLIADNLQKDYDGFLFKTLYFVIERAGSGHTLISFVGVQTLEQIAKSQECETVGDLLRNNVDYFSYHVTVKLRRVERNPGVLDVVGIVMKYSTMDVLPCLREIVEDVFLQLNKNFQRKNSYSFLKVFYTFVICIKNLQNRNTEENIMKERVLKVESKSSQVIANLLEYYEAKKIDEKIDEDPEEVTENEVEEEMVDYMDSKEKGVNLPPYIEMIEEVMKRCLHFLPSKEVQKSLIAMSTLQEGLEILAKWEDHLLPIVHLLWHPLVDRFLNENVLIINRAWQLLNVLGSLSKDFIRSRTLKQILPTLAKFLNDSAKESYNKSSESIYKFTQTFKLQKELLLKLGRTALNLQLQERELWTILSTTELYLSKHQHPVLQDCCVQLYKEMTDVNGDIVWVKCQSIWNSKISKIATDDTFYEFSFSENTVTNEYYKNIRTIVQYIKDKDIAIES